MSIALVVDAACDLPKDFIDERKIAVLPIVIEVDKKEYKDDKDPVVLSDFYRQQLLTLDHDADSRPIDANEMHELFKKQVLGHYDFAIVQTISQARSQIFKIVTDAQSNILQTYREGKANGEIEGHFGMRIMNSSTIFTGQGVLAAFTSDLIEQGKSKQDVVRLADSLKDKTYAFSIPSDVGYIRERAKRRGEKSVGAVGALVAKSLDIKPIILTKSDDSSPVAKVKGFENAVDKLFDYAIDRIRAGLMCPYIVISIAGQISDLAKYESFDRLAAEAKKHGIKVLACMMGLSSGLNLGPGAISLGLAAEEHEFG